MQTVMQTMEENKGKQGIKNPNLNDYISDCLPIQITFQKMYLLEHAKFPGMYL